MTGLFSYEGHELPARTPRDWLSPAWRRYIIWEVTELEFRNELLILDLLIRECHPSTLALHDLTPVERFTLVCSCWGGTGLKPGKAENWLCSADLALRLEALASFHKLMQSWPRTEDALREWEEFQAPDKWPILLKTMPVDVIERLERSVWKCYVQRFIDYRHRYPPLPLVRPAAPPFV